MGSLWRLRINWGISLALCTLVLVLEPPSYVLRFIDFIYRRRWYAGSGDRHYGICSTNLILNKREHIEPAVGVNIIPTMDVIYAIFGILVFLNCGFFVLLLHILYAVFLSKLGMKDSLAFPGWLEKTI